MANCCQSIIKYLIFIFNLVIAVAGLAVTGVSAYWFTQSEDSAFIFWIVLGIITFIISFFGCYGSLSENKCMIYTYATILFVVSLIEILIAVSIYDFLPGLPTTMKSDLNMYGKNATIKEGVDGIQKLFSCCGVINYEDWIHIPWNITSIYTGSHLNDSYLNVINYEDWNNNSMALLPALNVPASCCHAGGHPCTANNVHPVGCFEKTASVYTMASTATVCIALLQMIIGISSCWIPHTSRMGEENTFKPFS